MRVAVLEAGEADPVQPVAGPLLRPPPWARRGSAGPAMTLSRTVRHGKDGVLLEDEADLVADAAHRPPVDQRPRPAVGSLQPGDQGQRGGLAAAGRSDDGARTRRVRR